MADSKKNLTNKNQQSKTVDNRTYQQAAYDILAGQKVKIVFMDNKAITGVLKECRMFELILETKREGHPYQLVIAKAAIKYAAPIELFSKKNSK
ncbi:hypothetical protein LDL00_11570 [Staphylococcus epidermidis]|uniref:hypothetical protein n=1 Tax=Staphylococcus epidermidis TaxID=1282 RepID=UPI001E586A43|nr:hypothetical protein [Staphylococcus epidermidis]MCD9074463.1 hypothetical protein [Staphylococcus epidermidis]